MTPIFPLKIEEPNNFTASAGLFVGTTNNPANSNVGGFTTVAAGGILGATGGGGVIAGVNFVGDVEDLSETGTQAGIVVFGFTFAVTGNEDGSKITGLEVGFGGEGFGLGFFVNETKTKTTVNKSTK